MSPFVDTHNYGAHTSLLGAMGPRGVVAAPTVDGAVDTEVFNVYAEQVLGPRLCRGDVVVLDNLGTHRASRIEEVAEARTREHLEEALAAALALVTKADIRGWFRHCGYSLARE